MPIGFVQRLRLALHVLRNRPLVFNVNLLECRFDASQPPHMWFVGNRVRTV